MRDAASIMKKYGGLGTKKTKECLNAGLAKLYLKENVVDAFNYLSEYIYLLTDANRLIICHETEEERKGVNLFGAHDYYHNTEVYDLNSLDKDKTSFNIFKKKSGYCYSEITLSINQYGYLYRAVIYASEKDGEKILNKILKHADKYNKTADKNPKDTGSNENSNIKEIRAMYEDGIITKEEMMELLKGILRKG